MPIITLTTDLGIKDYYLASLKGSILSKIPEAQIVDITHQVPSFDIVQAGFILRNSFHYFPAGTIHIVSVDAGYTKYPEFVALSCEGHYFIGADNGLFSLISDRQPDELVNLDKVNWEKGYRNFPAADLFVQAAVLLAKGAKLAQLGKKMDDIERPGTLQPVVQGNMIKGTVVYNDSFKNAIINISRTLFDSVGKGRPFELQFRRHIITKLQEHYFQAEEGEIICLFDAAGLLEIAINKGKAADLLGLKTGETVLLEFK